MKYLKGLLWFTSSCAFGMVLAAVAIDAYGNSNYAYFVVFFQYALYGIILSVKE